MLNKETDGLARSALFLSLGNLWLLSSEIYMGKLWGLNFGRNKNLQIRRNGASQTAVVCWVTLCRVIAMYSSSKASLDSVDMEKARDDERVSHQVRSYHLGSYNFYDYSWSMIIVIKSWRRSGLTARPGAQVEHGRCRSHSLLKNSFPQNCRVCVINET